MGTLEIVADVHGDLDLARLPQQLLVQYPARGGRRLRKLMQELAVPEWQRERLPVMFAGPQARAPLAIADRWLAGTLRTTARSAVRGRIFWRELR
jgi:tRNA(Ile)-lysidine synthetase-like protein